MLGECCLWRGLLAPYYSWGSRRLKSLGSAALHCEATSSPGQHCSPWQSRSRPDLTHLTTGTHPRTEKQHPTRIKVDMKVDKAARAFRFDKMIPVPGPLIS